MQEPTAPCVSCLTEAKRGMIRCVLEVVAIGAVSTAMDVSRFIRCSLLTVTSGAADVNSAARAALKWLCEKHFIRWAELRVGIQKVGDDTGLVLMPIAWRVDMQVELSIKAVAAQWVCMSRLILLI